MIQILTHWEDHAPPSQGVRHLPLHCRLEDHVPRDCDPQETKANNQQRNQLTRSRYATR